MSKLYMNSKFEFFRRERKYYDSCSVRCSNNCSNNINGKVSTYDKKVYNSTTCKKCGSKMVTVKNYYTVDTPA